VDSAGTRNLKQQVGLKNLPLKRIVSLSNGSENFQGTFPKTFGMTSVGILQRKHMRYSKGTLKRARKAIAPKAPQMRKTFIGTKIALLDGSFHAAVKPTSPLIDDFFKR
jgi:hypothetical protein